jgi:hypothetical protein
MKDKPVHKKHALPANGIEGPAPKAPPVTLCNWWWCKENYFADPDDTLPLHKRGEMIVLPNGETPEGAEKCWVKVKRESFTPALDERAFKA